MATEVLAGSVEAAAKAAGLEVVSAEPAEQVDGGKTVRFTLARVGETAKRQLLELGEGLRIDRPELAEGLKTYLAEAALRLRNPRPEAYMTLHGLPLTFGNFAWPFHHSSSGADTSLVHGEIRLADGGDEVLHAKVSASMTLTFQEVLPAAEQPFAESFIYNAVRKTVDQGQLELVKSGNRQPVPVTTRYYSSKQKRFVFNDTSAEQRAQFLAGKIYWLSGVLGGGAPVWAVDPRDAQYLNTTVEELSRAATELAGQGALRLEGGFASATEGLMGQAEGFRAELDSTMAFIKPTFNEDMRAGHTNM